jgi:hypothetical protein
VEIVIKNKKKKRGLKMTVEVEKKALSSYAFEGCVQTVVGAFSTYNPKASKKEVEEYRREVWNWTVDEMNIAVNPMGLKVKVRKNANYFKLPKFAQKIYDSIKNLICVVECKDGKLLEIGVYIKTPTSKNPKFVPYKKGRSLDKN